MYAIDERDRVILVDALPQPDVGAPIPVLVADENRVTLAYVARPTQPSHDESIAVAEFVRPYAHMFGPPNDEAFEDHPLAGRGLEPYGVFRIEDSSWLRGPRTDEHRPRAPQRRGLRSARPLRIRLPRLDLRMYRRRRRHHNPPG